MVTKKDADSSNGTPYRNEVRHLSYRSGFRQYGSSWIPALIPSRYIRVLNSSYLASGAEQ